MKLSQLRPAQQVIVDELHDPVFRAEWNRTAFARGVAKELVGYRIHHDLTQRQVALAVGVTQSVIARLETGENPPSFVTLARISHGLGIKFHIDITPTSVELSAA